MKPSLRVLFVLLSIILGGSLMSCALEPAGTDVEEEIETSQLDMGHGEDIPNVETESFVESQEAAGADPSFKNCTGATPYVCYRNARAHCQPGGQLCGPGHCQCPCEWYCCDTPSNACF